MKKLFITMHSFFVPQPLQPRLSLSQKKSS